MTENSVQRKAEQLAAIAQALRDAPCPLAKHAMQPVPGEGNPDAKVFFIGEAPGKHEDLIGRPFVGAAGNILDELLQSISLRREEVFITSIEKFRPPNNREPTPKEVIACFPYLEAQIAIVQPGVIVTLGRHALRRMLEWESGKPLTDAVLLDSYHGKLIRSRLNNHAYFPMHHPAAALYNRKLLPVMRADMQKLRKVVV